MSSPRNKKGASGAGGEAVTGGQLVKYLRRWVNLAIRRGRQSEVLSHMLESDRLTREIWRMVIREPQVQS